MISKAMAAICAAVGLGACSTRPALTLDLERLLEDLAARQGEVSTVDGLETRVGRSVALGDGLNLAWSETVALALSPALRAVRSQADVAAAGAAASPGFPNPTLSVDALGVLGGGSPPVRVEAALTFPIPLSDRFSAAQDEARSEHAVALLQVAAI